MTKALPERLHFARVFKSPLQHAAKTCELAGFGVAAEIDSDLVEWNYGEYESLRLDEISAKRPDWELFRHSCPGAESPEQVGARAHRVVQRVRALAGDVRLFSSGHW
jgi:broad specificity phosphatase PhoE